MKTRIKIQAAAMLFAAVTGAIGPGRAQAQPTQESYTHAPALVRILDASECDTIQLPHQASRRWVDLFIPSFLRGQPVQQPCPPDIYTGALALNGVGRTIAPVYRQGFAGFNGTSTHNVPLTYELDQSLTYTEAVELFDGEAPVDGIYRTLAYAFAVEGSEDLVMAAQDDPIEPLDGPADLRDVHNRNKARVLDEWIKGGKLTSIALPANMPLRIAPTSLEAPKTMPQLCPSLSHLPTYTVSLVKARPAYDFGPGGWTVPKLWIEILHTQEIRDACPVIVLHRFVEGPSFFDLIPELSMQLEGQTTAMEFEWRQKIILQPLQAGGQAIEATAAFIATPHGQALVITVVILTAAAAFVGPQVYVLILVP